MSDRGNGDGTFEGEHASSIGGERTPVFEEERPPPIDGETQQSSTSRPNVPGDGGRRSTYRPTMTEPDTDAGSPTCTLCDLPARDVTDGAGNHFCCPGCRDVHEALDSVDVDDAAAESIVEAARDNVSVPYVNVTGYVDLTCPESDGVDAIKEAMQAAEGNGEVPEEIELDVTYVGAPEYRIEVQAPDYKTAESQLEASADRATAAIEERGGSAEYHRERTTEEE